MACVPSFTFSIDGNLLTVIEADGINTQLLVVDSIQIYNAQKGFRSIGVLFIDSINFIAMLAKHQRSRFLTVLMLSILVPEYIRSPTIIRPSTRAPTLIYHTFMRSIQPCTLYSPF
jgi:hypothetical protein